MTCRPRARSRERPPKVPANSWRSELLCSGMLGAMDLNLDAKAFADLATGPPAADCLLVVMDVCDAARGDRPRGAAPPRRRHCWRLYAPLTNTTSQLLTPREAEMPGDIASGLSAPRSPNTLLIGEGRTHRHQRGEEPGRRPADAARWPFPGDRSGHRTPSTRPGQTRTSSLPLGSGRLIEPRS